MSGCALDRPKHFLSYFLFGQKESTTINSKLVAGSMNRAIWFSQLRHYKQESPSPLRWITPVKLFKRR